MKLTLHEPTLEELWFRQQMLSDPETMSYNRAWGGTIPWPQEAWRDWYEWWIAQPQGKRFYRYLTDMDTGVFVGEIAYHMNEAQGMWMANVIVYGPYRGQGYGRTGLRLLCEAARESGVDVLYDDMAADNPALDLFLSEGFVQVSEDDSIRMLKKDLRLFP